MAGRLQIETAGKQDKYLTDDPEFSFFTQVHKKFTNFSRQDLKLVSNDVADFGAEIRYKLPQNQGDLLSKISFQFELDPIILFNYGYVDSVGHALIEYVDLIIGGSLIQRLTTDYLQIYSEQNITETKQYGLYKTIGKQIVENITDPYTNKYSSYNFNKRKTFVVDIPFYFHENPELFIPLCAIHKQEVEIVVKLRKLDELIIGKNFFKFEYPTVPYQVAYDANMNKDIHYIQYIPEVDYIEADAAIINGIGVLTSETYTQNKITPYLYSLKDGSLEYYGIYPYRITQFVPDLIPERESFAFWRFQTNLLYKSSDPSINKITSGRAIGSGTQFFGEEGSSSAATVPKYNTFVLGTPISGNVVYYVDKTEASRINVGADFGQSVAISDDAKIVATSAKNDTLKIIDFSDLTTPVLLETVDVGDVSAELRYVKVSGDGNWVMALDINNSKLFIYNRQLQKKYFINNLENDCYFDITNDGSKIIIGLKTLAVCRVYLLDETGYVLDISIDVDKPVNTAVHVAISRDGSTIFHTEGYVIKTNSLVEFKKTDLINFTMNTQIILLDENEKEVVKNTNKDFIITQLQQAPNQLIPLGEYEWNFRTEFVNCVKELYFVFQCQRYDNRLSVATCNYDNIDIDLDYQSNVVFYEHLYELQLNLNGEEILNKENGQYMFLKCIQSGLHHTRTPRSRRFYSYSFANEPEKHYPTGQRNFSVIQNQNVKIKLIPQNRYRRELRVYALSYNILRISDGTARTLFQERNIPTPGTANGLIGQSDRLPFIFANRFGYVIPCECPPIGCSIPANFNYFQNQLT